MSVLLNEIALKALLESRDGPVGQDLERRAQAVTEQARQNASRIVPRTLGMDIVGYAISNDAEGLLATIGVIGQGSISRYLAAKEVRERVWLVPALEAARI